MKTITIQKISYDKFEAIIKCHNCNRENKYIISNLPTRFPYPIGQIIKQISFNRIYCLNCRSQLKLGHINNIIFKDKDNVVNNVSYNVFRRKLIIKNKFVKCMIKINHKNTYPIILNKISCPKIGKTTNYKIKNKFVNFVFRGWIDSFYDVHKCLDTYTSDFPFELTPKNDLNNIKIKPPITKQQGNTDIKFSIINKTDVLVISDLRRCANQNHNVKDVIAILYTIINEHKQKQYINASFCFECCRYTISQSEFNNIKGKPICKIEWHNNSQIPNNIDAWDFKAQHSILYKLGYNVQKQSGLTPDMRRQILVNAIKSHKLSKGQICSYLEMFIKQKSGQSNMQDAVSKWRSDLQYIRNFKVSTNETIEVRKLIKK